MSYLPSQQTKFSFDSFFYNFATVDLTKGPFPFRRHTPWPVPLFLSKLFLSGSLFNCCFYYQYTQ